MIVWLAAWGLASAQEPADGDDTEPASAADLAELRAEIARQAEALAEAEAVAAAAEAQRDEQQGALQDLQTQITENTLALIEPHKLKMGFEGHYRVRGHVFNHLLASQTAEDGTYRDARYLEQRLWFRPRFAYRDLATLWIEFRALENVLFGDNASLASTPLFAGDPSLTAIDGREGSPVTLGRAWMELRLPVGLMRVGRQPSDWGMNLLVAPGDKFDRPFGESYYPTTNDRILFATRPIALLDTIIGREVRDIPLVAVVAVDRLVEDPLFQYFGYTCDPEVQDTDQRYDPRCDSDGDGVTDLDHSYVDEDVVAEGRSPDWWADQNDDVMQLVTILTYNAKGIDYLGGNGDLSVGAWVVNRTQRETESNIWIVDGYLKAFVHQFLLEAEFIRITGDTRALALPHSGSEDPLAKRASILGGAARMGIERPNWKVILEGGYASGDEDVTDERFTGRSLHPDHNVGLLLYEEVIRRVTASIRTTEAQGLWSNGGVYSSSYLFPTVHWTPVENLELIAGYVTAWPDRPDGAVIRCRDTDGVGCDAPTALQATQNRLGWELDLAVKIRWHQHLSATFESGIAHATDRLPLAAAGLNPEGNFFTVQSRLGFHF